MKNYSSFFYELLKAYFEYVKVRELISYRETHYGFLYSRDMTNYQTNTQDIHYSKYSEWKLIFSHRRYYKI